VNPIKSEIQDRAAGIFMWLVLVIPLLNEAFDEGHVRSLKEKLR